MDYVTILYFTFMERCKNIGTNIQLTSVQISIIATYRKSNGLFVMINNFLPALVR